MPDVNQYSDEKEWMQACVPMVMDENGGDQAAAVGKCKGMWEGKGASKAFSAKSVMSCAEACRMCVAACIDCMRMCMMSTCDNKKALNACIDACHHCIAVCTFCATVCESGNLAEIEKACQDCIKACDECYKACGVCAEKCPDCAQVCTYCADACERCSYECKTLTGASGTPMAMKYRLRTSAVKALDDWRLDVNPVPFGSRYSADSDGQWFDATTDIMEKAFNTPLVIYQHGVKRGARGMADKPLVIGESIPNTWNKQSDGWHIEVLLDRTKEPAADIMKAAHKREVAVSSDSISHLARLEVGGKLIQYEKNKAGRIAVWPLAGFSLWELGNGNFRPANRMAVALPTMKAMYREAGLRFPVILDTPGVLSYADEAERRAKVKQIQLIAKKHMEKRS